MTASHSNDAYQPITGAGPKLRSDVVDVYVFSRVPAADPREKSRAKSASKRAYESEPSWRAADASAVYFLQLKRATEPLKDTWHPVMGHVEKLETAVHTALREMREELGLEPSSPAVRGIYALEQVHPFYIAAIDQIILSPRFAVEVSSDWQPRLNAEHSSHRWIRADEVDAHFMWPGQKSCCKEIVREIVDDRSLSREALRITL